MTRLVLIADLHFGREDLGVVSELLTAIKTARADVVVVAGDFVQRARRSQFRPARAFLGEITGPVFAVPGNHDIPLFNIGARLLKPRAAFRRWIGKETEPRWRDAEVSLIGLDTTNRFSQQSGRVRPAQIERVCTDIRAAGERLPVIVAHHPFHQSPDVAKKLMPGAPKALAKWAGCGAHLILSGHVHLFHVEPFIARKKAGMTLQVHCGTSASTRLRGAANDFALLDVNGPDVAIRRMIHEPGASFTEASRYDFTRTASGWQLS